MSICRENATDQLQNMQASQEDRQRMLTILKRMEDNDDSDTALQQHYLDSETDDVGVSEDILKKLMLEVMHAQVALCISAATQQASIICPLARHDCKTCTSYIGILHMSP